MKTEQESHEKAFEDDPEGYAETYFKFIYENGDPNQIQACYNQIVERLPEDENWWMNYCTWCDQELKIPSVAYDVYKRAISKVMYNPWLWQGLITCAERVHEDPAEIDEYFECAKLAINDTQSGQHIYRTYAYLMRRRAVATDKDYTRVNDVFNDGRNTLSNLYGPDWDHDGIFRRNHAYFLASVMGNIDEARKLWQDILASGGGRFAEKWLEAVRLERQFGDVQNARKLLYKALNSVSDEPTVIYDYFIQFEREEGTLEELDEALEKVNAQQRHRSARPQKQKKERDAREKPQSRKRQSDDKHTGPPTKVAVSTWKSEGVKKEDQPLTPTVVKDKDGFTMPLPILVPRKGSVERIVKKSEPEPETSSIPTTRKSADGKWTVFCSNIDFKATEEDIRNALNGVLEVRLATRVGAKTHKGFAYVDLDSEEHYREALTRDHEITLGQRKMFISVNDPGNRPGFKYNTGKEASKLFVRNVHFDCTEEQLKEFFSQFGEVTSVRIVTHKSGKAKGVAYVDFNNEDAAGRAVDAKDLVLLDRKLIVAISNPPARDGSTASTPIPSTPVAEASRRSHIQIVPRAVTKKTSNGNSTGLSNDEFRKKFLGS